MPAAKHQPFFILVLLSVLVSHAHAARPLNTDDANIVERKSCQVESWIKSGAGNVERWAIPGCNFGGDVEWSLGGSSQNDVTAGISSAIVAQGKFRWRPVEPGSWGLSTTVGIVQQKQDVAGFSFRDMYVNVPVTWSLKGDRYLHANLGAVQHGDTGFTRATYGLGSEFPFTPTVIGVAEAFGESGSESKYQVGLRFWVVPQRIQIDTTYGNSFGAPGGGQWFSIGLRLLSSAFLP